MADPLATLHPDVQREISTLLETFRTKQRAEAPENLAEILKGVVQDPIVAILEREANLRGNTPHATALRALAFGMRSPANAGHGRTCARLRRIPQPQGQVRRSLLTP
jgi:hypothetical protein